MPKRLSLLPHLSCEELEERYRQVSDAVERSQHQILWLLAKGKQTGEVREVTGYSLRWIRLIANRYNKAKQGLATDGITIKADNRYSMRCNKHNSYKR